jgi:hypothetical protein
MPSAHTTDGFSFRQVLRDKALKPSICAPFDEPLLYFFYGRPSYRVLKNFGPTSLSCFSTACFIFDTQTLPKPKRIFPFDTGAWIGGYYSDFIHPEMNPLHFEVHPTYSDAAKIVDLFFGSNQSYYSGRCRPDLALDVLDMEGQCLKAMLSTPGRTKFDDRRGTIELQLEGPLSLNDAKVIGIVLPSHFMDDPAVRKFCDVELGTSTIPYDCHHASPAEDTRAIMEVVGKFFRERGYI